MFAGLTTEKPYIKFVASGVDGQPTVHRLHALVVAASTTCSASVALNWTSIVSITGDTQFAGAPAASRVAR
jgi:hypothetical protein